MAESYWQTREGRLEEAIRQGLRDAGVQGALAGVAGPVLRRVLDELERSDASPRGLAKEDSDG